jgi:hypothetical protein
MGIQMRGVATRVPAVARLIAVACLAACGGATDNTPGSADAASDDGGDEVDAGDDGGADASPERSTGEVYVFARNYTNNEGTLILSSTASAVFGDYKTEDCVVALAGANCQVLDCTSRDPGPPQSAGTILVEGNLQETTLVPGSAGYAQVDLGELIFSDGNAVSVSAPGDEVPNFSVTADCPYHIGFTGGVPTSAGPVKITASQDWQLFWSSFEQDDVVRIDVVGPRDNGGLRRRIDCSVPASDNQVTLTSTALGMMPLGEVVFEARVEQSLPIEVGEYDVTIKTAVVMRAGDSPEFNWASGSVLLGR